MAADHYFVSKTCPQAIQIQVSNEVQEAIRMDATRCIFSALLILGGLLLIYGNSTGLIGYLMVIGGVTKFLIDPRPRGDQ